MNVFNEFDVSKLYFRKRFRLVFATNSSSHSDQSVESQTNNSDLEVDEEEEADFDESKPIFAQHIGKSFQKPFHNTSKAKCGLSQRSR